MASSIRNLSLRFRSGYFIDLLRHNTKLGFTALEERVRKNQYESLSLTPPSFDLVRDYFRLHRSVAFEPRNEAHPTGPWLVAAELEFPCSSFAFFHPMFDWLFGQVESSAYWQANFEKVPAEWIAEMERQGDQSLADEWRTLNREKSRILHRRKEIRQVNDLELVHLTMLRLPQPYRGRLFSRQGLTFGWTRSHDDEAVVDWLASQQSVDSLCALILLADEAARIGSPRRFKNAREAALSLLPTLPHFPGCHRISEPLGQSLLSRLSAEEFTPRRYSLASPRGSGLPISWSAMAYENSLEEFTAKRSTSR